MSSGREIVVVLIIVVVYTIQLSNCDEEMKCDYLSPKENCTYLINYAEFLSGQDDGQKDFCSGYFIKRALDLCERFNLNWEACTVSMRKECHPVSVTTGSQIARERKKMSISLIWVCRCIGSVMLGRSLKTEVFLPNNNTRRGQHFLICLKNGSTSSILP
ncbi:uncharacterized protein LOC142344147 isoform X1 [Convolutriloba macropyga]|uniref:uncharacterized protein LOC142344147 isoform X1 n=1 Tax=Convolutriloba macropyga TaxID=536237 RepID=UPI003F51E7D9